jgi:hypothetical protein
MPCWPRDRWQPGGPGEPPSVGRLRCRTRPGEPPPAVSTPHPSGPPRPAKLPRLWGHPRPPEDSPPHEAVDPAEAFSPHKESALREVAAPLRPPRLHADSAPARPPRPCHAPASRGTSPMRPPHPSGASAPPRGPSHQGLRPRENSLPREDSRTSRDTAPHETSALRGFPHLTRTPATTSPRTQLPRTPPVTLAPPEPLTQTVGRDHGSLVDSPAPPARPRQDVRAGRCGGPGKLISRGQLPGLYWPIDNGGQRGRLGHSQVDAAIP